MAKALSEIKPEILNSLTNKDRNISVLPVELVLLTLPSGKVSNNVFERISKKDGIKLSMNTIVQKKDGKEFSYGLPYGKYSRKILYYVCSEVKRTKSPLIRLGNDFAEVLQNLNIVKNKKTIGGNISNDVKDQFMRLANSLIQIERTKNSPDNKRTVTKGYLKLIKSIKFLEDNNSDEDASTIKDFEIVLTQDFFNYIMETSSTIFDADIIYSLNSPMSMDLFVYLNFRTHFAQKHKREIFISFEDLYEQFGTQTTKKEFNRNVKENLVNITKHHPRLLTKITKKGGKTGILILEQSKTVIEPTADLLALMEPQKTPKLK